MGSNVVFFGWNRPVPSRERVSAQHLEEFVNYLGGLQRKGTIQAFDIVLLDAHGGDLNGFFLIKAESAKLDALLSTAEWVTHMTRAVLHLEGSGAIRGVTGENVAERMALWAGAIPS
jgi:hypothetical protein